MKNNNKILSDKLPVYTLRLTQILKQLIIFLFFTLIVVYTSCSSAPKNRGDIDTLRSQGETWLETGNKQAGLGAFENALSILTETKRNAILADDSSLIIRVCLSRGNVLFSLARTDEAFAEWDHAVAEAQRLGNAELLSVSRIYHARGNLITQRQNAQSVLSEVTTLSTHITNARYTAFSWQVRGLALRAMGSYSEAESAMRRSLDINERGSYLESASYDWYTIASIRSLAGNFSGAISALESSIAIDRRIENSWGLAASYRASGDVHRRAGRSDEAAEAYARARMIYAAMGNDHETAEIDRRTNNNE